LQEDRDFCSIAEVEPALALVALASGAIDI